MRGTSPFNPHFRIIVDEHVRTATEASPVKFRVRRHGLMKSAGGYHMNDTVAPVRRSRQFLGVDGLNTSSRRKHLAPPSARLCRLCLVLGHGVLMQDLTIFRHEIFPLGTETP